MRFFSTNNEAFCNKYYLGIFRCLFKDYECCKILSMLSTSSPILSASFSLNSSLCYYEISSISCIAYEILSVSFLARSPVSCPFELWVVEASRSFPGICAIESNFFASCSSVLGGSDVRFSLFLASCSSSYETFNTSTASFPHSRTHIKPCFFTRFFFDYLLEISLSLHGKPLLTRFPPVDLMHWLLLFLSFTSAGSTAFWTLPGIIFFQSFCPLRFVASSVAGRGTNETSRRWVSVRFHCCLQ